MECLLWGCGRAGPARVPGWLPVPLQPWASLPDRGVFGLAGLAGVEGLEPVPGVDEIVGPGPAVGDLQDLAAGMVNDLGGEVEDPDDFLNRNDSGTFFARLGDGLVTGPSGHNLNDFRAIAVN